MPSFGLWPITVIGLSGDELAKLSFQESLLSPKQILFLIRTDFTMDDVIDFISHTDEYFSMPPRRRPEFLNRYTERIKNDPGILTWSEKIAGMAIGIAVKLSQSLDLRIEPVEANLPELDDQFRFGERNLKSFRLFDINNC